MDSFEKRAILFSVIIAIIMIPILGEILEESKVYKALILIEEIDLACNQYYGDMNSYALEYSDYPLNKIHAHNLYMYPGSTNWKNYYIGHPDAKYLDKPLTPGVSPFGSIVRVYNQISESNGFDLDGDGYTDRRGDGNYVLFRNVSLSAAKKLNKKFDGNLSKENWQETGRVEYSDRIKEISIYLLGGSK